VSDNFEEGLPEELNLDFGEDVPQHPADEGLNLDFDAVDDNTAAETETPEEPEISLNLDFDVPEEEPEEEEPELDEAEQAALDQLHDRLLTEVGDWYVVHTYSGMENRVKQNLENRIKALGMEDYIYEIVVPTEDVMETRNGAKKRVTRTILPGYVLVRMDLNEASWSAVRHTPSVTGFVAHASDPVPLNLDEVEKMLAPSVLAKVQAESSGPKRRKKVQINDFSVGDSVMVSSGAFAGIHATITEIDLKRERLRALVEILGRETPVDLTFSQISKID
jgi:transcriptional antiterminator NusG